MNRTSGGGSETYVLGTRTKLPKEGTMARSSKRPVFLRLKERTGYSFYWLAISLHLPASTRRGPQSAVQYTPRGQHSQVTELPGVITSFLTPQRSCWIIHIPIAWTSGSAFASHGCSTGFNGGITRTAHSVQTYRLSSLCKSQHTASWSITAD